MKTFLARVKVTYDCPVTVDAENIEEARRLLMAGKWDTIIIDDLTDWDDPDDLREDK